MPWKIILVADLGVVLYGLMAAVFPGPAAMFSAGLRRLRSARVRDRGDQLQARRAVVVVGVAGWQHPRLLALVYVRRRAG